MKAEVKKVKKGSQDPTLPCTLTRSKWVTQLLARFGVIAVDDLHPILDHQKLSSFEVCFHVLDKKKRMKLKFVRMKKIVK